MVPKRKIKARDIVNDIRSHMTDPELMAKYDLSARGLQSAFIKLLNARAITHAEMNQRRAIYHDKTLVQQIDARDIVKDIRSGMSDSELLKKYDLSSEGLRFALQTLTDTEVITLEELYATSSSAYDTVFVENMRELPRHHLSMAVTIYEATRPEVKGTLRDITEKGVGITGIPARVGEVKTLVIPAETFIQADKIVFEAKCAWAQTEGTEDQYFAGFQITSISEECREDLRSLIRSVCFPG
jgi:uncharacterized protein (DUF433 family)